MFVARGRSHRPECNAHSRSTGDLHAAAQAEDRVQNRTHCVGQGPTIGNRDRRANGLSAPQKPAAVRFELNIAGAFAFDHGEMGGPNVRVARGAFSPGCNDRTFVCGELRFDEKLCERGVGNVVGLTRE